MTSQSWSHVETGGFEPRGAEGVPEPMARWINELFKKKGERRITVWFQNHLGGNNLERLDKCLLSPLQWAVRTYRTKDLVEEGEDVLAYRIFFK